MTKYRFGPAVAVLVALSTVLTTTASAVPAAHAAAAKRCDITTVAQTLGPTSVDSLQVVKTSCASGIAIVKAFHTCRLAHGPAGRCVKKVKGYACREARTSGPTQFTAKVTCTKKRMSVVHAYTQAT